MDPALWAELEAWAAQELRSVNGQIEYVLRQAIQKRRSSALPASPAETAPAGNAPPPASPSLAEPNE